MHFRIDLGFSPLGAELLTQRIPKPFMCGWIGNVKKEGKILTDFAVIVGYFKFAILSDSVIDKKLPVKRLLPYHLP